MIKKVGPRSFETRSFREGGGGENVNGEVGEGGKRGGGGGIFKKDGVEDSGAGKRNHFIELQVGRLVDKRLGS